MSAVQLSFDAPRARRNDPATSKAAAAKVWGGWAGLVVECLAMYGPASDDRICIRLNVDPRRWPSVKSARSRVVHAEDPAKRLIVETDETEHGQTIWRHRDYSEPVRSVDVAGGRL